MSSDGTHVWVTNAVDGNAAAGTVSEIDASTGTVVNTITVGSAGSYPPGVSSDGTHVWVANAAAGTVSEIGIQKGRYAAHVVGGEYVALGDSFSSGEGSRNYEGPPHEPAGSACHRSPQSWPSLVKTELGSSTFVFEACSGAELHDFYEEGKYDRNVPSTGGGYEHLTWGEPPQLNGIAPENVIAPSVKLVTFSVGGNDAGFAEIVRECAAYFPRLTNKQWAKLDKECKNFGTERVTVGRAALIAGENHNGKSLTYILEQVHMRAPDAWIRVLLYPTLFAMIPSGQCGIGASVYADLTAKEITYINGWEKDVNKTIESIVKKWAKPLLKREPKSVDVVNAEAAFSGGNLCTTTHEFMNKVTVFGESTETEPESVHPTARGYEQLSAAVLKTLEE